MAPYGVTNRAVTLLLHATLWVTIRIATPCTFILWSKSIPLFCSNTLVSTLTSGRYPLVPYLDEQPAAVERPTSWDPISILDQLEHHKHDERT